MVFQFSVQAWRAVAPGLAQEAQWRAWAEGMPTETQKLALDFIPALQRRRLSPAARLMFAAAHPLAAQYGNTPVVYCSHDGEINRSFQLWLALLAEHAVSPMSFGLSVHNAVAGQWSIFSNNTAEHTALSARQAGLEIAVAEACLLLAEGIPQVLAVIGDEPLQPQYAVNAERAPFPYALALLLRAGDTYRLRRFAQQKRSAGHYYGALDWIRAAVLGRFPLQQHYDDCAWLWEKK